MTRRQGVWPLLKRPTLFVEIALDVMVTGVTGTRLQTAKACQYSKWDILADGPAETCCRPFDRDRTGEVLAEASCTLILEAREHAEARGAKILGTVLGCGASTVSGRDGTPDEAAAVYQAAFAAASKAGISAEEIGHVNASASGHPLRDQMEAAGIRRFLGGAADRVPVTAIKSYMGSSGSGAGLCEIAAPPCWAAARSHSNDSELPHSGSRSTPETSCTANIWQRPVKSFSKPA